jgi:hypothetical protein
MKKIFGGKLAEVHSKGFSGYQLKFLYSKNFFLIFFCRQIFPLFLRNFSPLGNVVFQ